MVERLKLGFCTKVTDVALTELSEGCPKMKHLDVSYCKHVTDVGLIKLAKCTQLTTLNLSSP
jgi:F-box/leucine-rich repeat protein 2/20